MKRFAITVHNCQVVWIVEADCPHHAILEANRKQSARETPYAIANQDTFAAIEELPDDLVLEDVPGTTGKDMH